MALQGNSNEEKIWNYLKSKGLNNFGVAGLMGNLQAESGLNPKNLQNNGNTKLGMTDDQFTAAYDKGEYTNFVHDSYGYGLAQWTYWSRKQNLANFAKSKSKSIGDLEMQLDFLYKELSEGYKSVLKVLQSATSVLQASNAVLLDFERPTNQSTSVQSNRAEYGQQYYNKYAININGGNSMSNSSLISYTKISPNKNSPRNHVIDTITIHCYVGQVSVENAGAWFAKSSAQCSCNYVIGTDGRIALIVDESDRSWCSSSSSNDNRAITIECASDTTSPYAINSKVYKSLISLCVDICKRNNIKQLLWKADKSLIGQVSKQNMTVHRWFANKACPGDYIYNRLGQIASEVNAKLGSSTTSTSTTTQTSVNTSFPATPFAVQVLVSDLNYRSIGSMSGKVLGQTGKGTFTITEIKDGWGKLKSGAGWIYLENASYVKIGSSIASSSTSSISSTSYKVKVTADVLNIRKGAGTNYAITGTIKDKGTYTIVAESSGTGATKWGKLKSGAGWISLDYCQKV